MLITFLEVHVKPETRDKYIALATYLSKHSAADEPGCLRFDFLEDREDPNTFYYYEVFRDEEAAKAHGSAPHHLAYNEQILALLDEKGRIGRRARSLNPTDQEWR